MDKVRFTSPETGEEMELFLLEETQLGGIRYLLAAEREEGDCECFILREVEADGEESVYEIVTDDAELGAVGRVFGELFDDADIEIE